jgi:iron complex outermembrane recepter protein
MLKRILITLIISLVAIEVFPQSILSGKVTDDKTGVALIGATIFIPDLQKGTNTDSSGSYSLANIPKGTWLVECSYLGYQNFTQKISFNDANTKINFPIQPSLQTLDEVVISGGYISSAKESPVLISKISTEQLAQTGGTTLMNALATEPGISEVTTGNYAGKPVIRGLSYDRVLVVDEGMRVENQQWGDEHGLSLNGLGIGGVEIVKGPGSLLYGSGAMGGVINLLPEKPADEGSIEGHAAVTLFSNTAGEKGELFVKGAGKLLNWNFGSSYEEQGDYLTGNNIRATNSNFNELSQHAGIGISTVKFTSSLDWNYTHTELGIPDPTMIDSSETFAVHTIYPSHQDLRNTFISSQSTFFFGESKLKINLGYEHNIREELDPDSTGNEITGLGLDLQAFNYDIKWYSDDSGHSQVITGVQGLAESNTNFGTEFLIPNATEQDFSAYALYHFKTLKWIIEGGFRYQLNHMIGQETGAFGEEGYHAPFNLTFNSPNGVIGATYNASDVFTFKADVASGFRSPNLSELSANGVHEGTFRYEIGNLNLKTEQNLEFDFNTVVTSRPVNTELDLFYNFFNNFIYIAPTADSIDGYEVYRYSQKNAVLYGGEYSLDIHPDPISWLHYEPSVSVVFEKATDGSNLPFTPAPKIVNELKADLPYSLVFHNGYAFFKVESVFSQNNIAEFEVATPAYTLLDAGIGGDFTIEHYKVQLDLTGNNITNVAYIDFLSRLKADPITSSLYNMGRNITLGAKLNF